MHGQGFCRRDIYRVQTAPVGCLCYRRLASRTTAESRQSQGEWCPVAWLMVKEGLADHLSRRTPESPACASIRDSLATFFKATRPRICTMLCWGKKFIAGRRNNSASLSYNSRRGKYNNTPAQHLRVGPCTCVVAVSFLGERSRVNLLRYFVMIKAPREGKGNYGYI